MVSGLVTSPCDQLRIFSGEARLMRMASKSAMAFPRSNGLERYKVSSSPAGLSDESCRDLRPLRGCWRLPVFPVSLGAASLRERRRQLPQFSLRTSDLVGRDRSRRERSALIGLDQFHI